jgi:hypothetical protein
MINFMLFSCSYSNCSSESSLNQMAPLKTNFRKNKYDSQFMVEAVAYHLSRSLTNIEP